MTFSQINSLTAQSRTHTDENPYKCKVIRIRFSQNGNFTIYLKKTYVLVICMYAMKNIPKDVLTNNWNK